MIVKCLWFVLFHFHSMTWFIILLIAACLVEVSIKNYLPRIYNEAFFMVTTLQCSEKRTFSALMNI